MLGFFCVIPEEFEQIFDMTLIGIAHPLLLVFMEKIIMGVGDSKAILIEMKKIAIVVLGILVEIKPPDAGETPPMCHRKIMLQYFLGVQDAHFFSPRFYGPDAKRI